MISLPNKLPLVRLPDHRVVALEPAWLENAINEAADDAGYEGWWLAPHIIESVTNYLEQEFDANAIGCENLDALIANLLRVIGYSDVARHFSLPEPPIRISLYALAQNAGTGFELAFFDHLHKSLEQAIESRSAQVELLDLAECVKLLRNTRTWRKDCSLLRDEIVAHARAHAKRTLRARPLNLSLL